MQGIVAAATGPFFWPRMATQCKNGSAEHGARPKERAGLHQFTQSTVTFIVTLSPAPSTLSTSPS
jgi:hypothetical protein